MATTRRGRAATWTGREATWRTTSTSRAPLRRYSGAHNFIPALGQFLETLEEVQLLMEVYEGENAMMLYDSVTGPAGTSRTAEAFTLREGADPRVQARLRSDRADQARPPAGMRPPEQIQDASPADILETITKAVFQAGMSWRVVEAKWPGFREAFAGFDPERVGALTPDDVARLKEDTRIIRTGARSRRRFTTRRRSLPSTRTPPGESAPGSDPGAASRRRSTPCARSSSSSATWARTTCCT